MLNKSILSPLLESLPSEDREELNRSNQNVSYRQAKNSQVQEGSEDSVCEANFQPLKDCIEIRIQNQTVNCSQVKAIENGFSSSYGSQNSTRKKHEDPFGGAKPREEVLKARQQQSLHENESFGRDKGYDRQQEDFHRPQPDRYQKEKGKDSLKQRNEVRRPKVDPFGGARPREEVLKSRQSSISAASVQSAQDSNYDVGSFASNSTMEECRHSRGAIRSQLLA
eukprot:TRINITY_DN40426_c0_g1_i3.p2 TRINITY_DN40426_c0_g1~~TRINITY_DN40426_c0_g1_i3.p2  ORF type:complete len:224 (-),score=30.57 TRINITY_DN40426_c0_g1_i3:961-1632(-)